MREKKQEIFFFNYKIYTKIIVINLINNELIWNLLCDFSLEREKIFYINICVLCDYYFKSIIFVII